MEVTCLINLLSLVIKHSGCELDDDDAGYTQEKFAELVELIFIEINQFNKWEEEEGTGTPDDLEDEKDEVLAFHKGTLSLLVVIITSFI